MFQWLRSLLSVPVPVAPVPAVPAAPEPLPPHTAARAAVPTFEQKDLVDSAYYRWLFDARDDDGLDLSPAETGVLEALAAVAASGQSGADLVRRMPGLLPQVLQSLRSENFSGADVARKISSDVVLVAAVIRLANCAGLHEGKRISSVEHAVIVIGQEGLRQLVTTVAFRPIIDLHTGRYTRLLAPRIWDQSERCAVAGRLQAEQDGGEPFEAFLAGLLHNVGLLVSLRMMDQVGAGGALGSAMFCARLAGLAGELSCRIAHEWKFPSTVVRAIGEQGQQPKGTGRSSMGGRLAVGDYLSKARILAEHGALDDTGALLFEGLPAPAQACYAALHAIGEDAPA